MDKGDERGQSLIIALAVMFVLVFLGTLFIVIVSRNLTATGRSTEQNEARYLAEAGIRYADRMLTQSEAGADWRPVPDNQGAIESGKGPDGIVQLVPDNGAYGWQWLKEHHPDFKWVRPYWPTEEGWRGPTGGFTTVDSGEGRFLIRVTYDPKKLHTGAGVAYDPISKYIKIESIGRTGDLRDLYVCPTESGRPDGYKSSKPGRCPNDGAVLEIDPTVLSGLKTSLKSELSAYKPICLTDYARFITNKEKRPVIADLGCPGFATQYGYHLSPNDYRGSPIRVNGNLRWNGSSEPFSDDRANPVTIYLSGYTYERYDEDSQRYYTSEVPTDTVEVAGDIEHGMADGEPTRVFVRKIINGTLGSPQEVFPSSSKDPPFTTLGGFYRDGRDETEGPTSGAPFTYTRGVRRIEPPDITEPDPATGLMRYRVLTAYSGDWFQDASGNRYRLGQIGWGHGIYINNRDDLQRESEGIFGGYTVVKDWMDPNNFMLSYWQGPYYVPPGVVITLNPNDTDGDGQPDITITRTDIRQGRNSRYVWRDIRGRPREIWGETITVPYPTPFRKVREPNPDPNQPDTGPATIPLPGNGVIFAEGNIRIKGMLPKSHRADPNDPNSPWVRYNLTIVSGGIIYIEGSILKNRSVDGRGNIVTDHSGSVALLASEYVCVNTTQFVSMLPSGAPLPQGSDAMNGEPPYHLVIGTTPSASFRSSFTLGPWDALDNPGDWNGNIYAFVRHAGQYGPAYINLLVNPGYPDARYGVYNFGSRPPVPPNIYGVGDPLSGSYPGVGLTTSFEHKAWHLNRQNSGIFMFGADDGSIGYPNFLEIVLAQEYLRSDYLLSGLAIQPMNVRIEAIIYAQNRSFFVIPGRWFNPDPTDTRNKADRPAGTDPRFPFFGEPLDTRIVIDGAISENLPAKLPEVSDWMAKWGRTPPTYGSSGEKTAHNQRGLTFLYDPHLGWPLDDSDLPIRRDQYGRALPIAPCLPVSPSLVYFGEPV